MLHIKKVLSKAFILVFVFLLMIPTQTMAATTTKTQKEEISITTKQYKEIMKAYTKILVDNPYKDRDGGFVAEKFLIKDLNDDGIPELIINDSISAIFTYDFEHKSAIFIFDCWIVAEHYYSAKTNQIMEYYSWNGSSYWSFLEFYKNEDRLGLTDTKFLSVSYSHYDYTDKESGVKKGYYKNTVNKKGEYVSTKITKATLDKEIKKLVPDKEVLKGTIKNTKKNRTKYLADVKAFKKLALK